MLLYIHREGNRPVLGLEMRARSACYAPVKSCDHGRGNPQTRQSELWLNSLYARSVRSTLATFTLTVTARSPSFRRFTLLLPPQVLTVVTLLSARTPCRLNGLGSCGRNSKATAGSDAPGCIHGRLAVLRGGFFNGRARLLDVDIQRWRVLSSLHLHAFPHTTP